MAIDADKIDHGVTKGKAVIVLHAWKDHLWAIGSKGEPPEAVTVSMPGDEETGAGDDDKDAGPDGGEGADALTGAVVGDGPVPGPEEEILTPDGKCSPHSNIRDEIFLRLLFVMSRFHLQRYPLVYELRSCKLYERLSLISHHLLSRCPLQLYTQCTFFAHEQSRGQLPHPSTSSIPRSSHSPPSYALQKREVYSK